MNKHNSLHCCTVKFVLRICMGKTAVVAKYTMTQKCVCGEWNGMYYCCSSQLKRKKTHMTFRATAFSVFFFLLCLLHWFTLCMLMPVSSHCDRKSDSFWMMQLFGHILYLSISLRTHIQM